MLYEKSASYIFLKVAGMLMHFVKDALMYRLRGYLNIALAFIPFIRMIERYDKIY